MDCEKAKACMNGFIENTLNEKDMFELSEHIGECDKCMEEFSLYASIVGEIENQKPVENVPVDLECNVMKKISGIEFKTDKILSVLLGTISVYMGVFMIISFNGEFIRRIIERNRDVEIIADGFVGKASDIILFFDGIFERLSDILSQCNFSLRNFSLAVFIFLVGGKFIRFCLNRGGNRV